MNRRLGVVPAMACALALAGCSGMSTTEERTLSGAAIGTGVGVAVGAVTGEWAWAAGGAVAGAAGGYIYDQQKQKEQRAYEQGVQAGKSQPQKK